MTQFVFVTDEDVLRKVIREEITGTTKDIKTEIDPAERKNRRQAATFLGVSYQTMHEWTKKGIVKEHGHGRKKFYLRSELIESQINNNL